MKILIADDHFVVRSGLELVIGGYYAHAELHFACNFDELFEKVQEQSYSMLILDAVFPEGNSLSIIEKILDVQPGLKILIYSALEDPIYAPKYLGLGVKGYLNKLASEEEILTAITKILQGELYFSKSLKETLLKGLLKQDSANPFEKLSHREFEIMTLMAEGEANLEISNKLDIKPSTISTYKKRLFEKLQVKNLSELIVMYKVYHPN